MKVKVLNLKEGMILKHPVFSNELVLMDRGQVITEKHIERLKHYHIHEVDIVSDKELKLREIKEKEKIIKEEFKKAYKETVVKTKELFSKAIDKDVDNKVVDSIVGDTLKNLEKNSDIFLTLLSMREEGNYLYEHSIKTTIIALSIGKRLGYKEEELRLLGKACLLHDIGMFSIDNTILNKKEKLTEKELITIRNHTKEGAEILKKEEEVVRLCALHHHERVDGEGYPNKIKGEELPEIVRIVSIADVYTALISDRGYREAKDPKEAITYLMQMSAKQVDTNIVKKLLENMSLFAIGSYVRLNNGLRAKVVKATENPFRPVVDVEEGDKFERIDLSDRDNALIYIMRLIV